MANAGAGKRKRISLNFSEYLTIDTQFVTRKFLPIIASKKKSDRKNTTLIFVQQLQKKSLTITLNWNIKEKNNKWMIP